MATEEKTQFTHVGIEKKTHKKIALLANIQGGKIYEMVGDWADEAWVEAKKQGLVNDAMLGLRKGKSATKKAVAA